MRKAFKASRLMGLLALMAGFMAFGASAAQAEPGAYWLVNGQDIGTILLPEVQAEKDSPHLTFLTKIGLSSVELLCTDIKFVGAKLHQLGRVTGKIHLSGCTTKLNGSQANACTPKSPGAPLGLIETNALEGLIKLHTGGVELLELRTVGGGPLVTLEMGATCAIGNKIDLTGKLFLKDCTNEGLVDKVKHLFEEEKTLSKLFFGGNPMTLHGSFWTFLVGLHAGDTWAGHAA